MSLIIKRQLLSIIDTMENALTILQQLLTANDVNNVIAVLTECQNCAIEVGNKIEKIYGENPDVIHPIEIYCESVYKLAETVSNQLVSSGKCEQLYEQLCKQLNAMSESIQNKLPDKREVVFLPYKASMWDSLESVYLAAKEDENCNVYCIPIPYFDKNTDGSLGTMHHEINEFPSGTIVTDYHDYNLAERMPDAIYIHNPYDNWNHVTSVHPDFYCKNLRDFTDNLVYIPYFVLGEINPANQSAINGMKHFCFLPGTIYANHIIVQSEDMKQIYVTEFMKAAAENGLSGSYIDRSIQENRFLGLGSPKFDKISNTTGADFVIPDEWQHIITASDGKRKKVVLYNTTIGTFLTYREKMLEKIKSVLGFFYTERENAALLWRPHPLMESTIKSMHPDLLQEYDHIVSKYKQEAWGIYDDTADLHRAIALSDCYYGDHSSVVQLYQKTGKPIMIQNVSIL